jgi:hypothetical protein
MQLNGLTNLLISFPNKYTLLSRRLPTFLGYRVVRPLSVGMFLLGTHYRAPINYIVERLNVALDRLGMEFWLPCSDGLVIMTVQIFMRSVPNSLMKEIRTSSK